MTCVSGKFTAKGNGLQSQVSNFL